MTKKKRAGVKLMPSRTRSPEDPGHMSVYWRKSASVSVFRGFRFNVADLPVEFRSADKWREYLFVNKTPGYICDDIMMLDDIKRNPGKVLCMGWVTDRNSIESLEASAGLSRSGWYSFSPDRFEGTHNCVTWAITTIRNALGDVLDEIPNGRIKLAVKQLERKGAKYGE